VYTMNKTIPLCRPENEDPIGANDLKKKGVKNE
jgi:hypothetical protein